MSERLADLAPLVGVMARERTRDRPALYDDARQEGLIRAWLTLREHPDAPQSHVTQAARRGVGDVVRGRKPFGAESRRGYQDAHTTSTPLPTWVTEEGVEEQVEVPDSRGNPEVRALPHASPETLAALAALPELDARMVSLRFGAGLSLQEIAGELGLHGDTVRKRMKMRVIPALRASLSDLAA